MATPIPVQFYALSTGIPAQIAWDFGDGSDISNEANPYHIFPDAALYTVQLCMVDLIGNQSCVSKDVDLSGIVPPLAPYVYANWSYTNDDLTASFLDLSYGVGGERVVQWAWDFGDGGTSTEQSPTHVYSEAGNYRVQLEITGSFGTVNWLIQTVSVGGAWCYLWLGTAEIIAGSWTHDVDESYSQHWSAAFGTNMTRIEFGYTWNGVDGAGVSSHVFAAYDSVFITPHYSPLDTSPGSPYVSTDAQAVSGLVEWGLNGNTPDGGAVVSTGYLLLEGLSPRPTFVGGTSCFISNNTVTDLTGLYV